jgi:hypothetical protein
VLVVVVVELLELELPQEIRPKAITVQTAAAMSLLIFISVPPMSIFCGRFRPLSVIF